DVPLSSSEQSLIYVGRDGKKCPNPDLRFGTKPLRLCGFRRSIDPRSDRRYRLIPDRAFWIPAVAQGAHGVVKNLNPFSTKKFGSIPGGMKYIAATTPCFAALAAILSSA